MIGALTASEARHEIERVWHAGSADSLLPPTSMAGGPPMTKGLHRTDQGTRKWLTKGLELD